MTNELLEQIKDFLRNVRDAANIPMSYKKQAVELLNKINNTA